MGAVIHQIGGVVAVPGVGGISSLMAGDLMQHLQQQRAEQGARHAATEQGARHGGVELPSMADLGNGLSQYWQNRGAGAGGRARDARPTILHGRSEGAEHAVSVERAMREHLMAAGERAERMPGMLGLQAEHMEAHSHLQAQHMQAQCSQVHQQLLAQHKSAPEGGPSLWQSARTWRGSQSSLGSQMGSQGGSQGDSHAGSQRVPSWNGWIPRAGSGLQGSLGGNGAMVGLNPLLPGGGATQNQQARAPGTPADPAAGLLLEAILQLMQQEQGALQGGAAAYGGSSSVPTSKGQLQPSAAAAHASDQNRLASLSRLAEMGELDSNVIQMMLNMRDPSA